MCQRPRTNTKLKRQLCGLFAITNQTRQAHIYGHSRINTRLTRRHRRRLYGSCFCAKQSRINTRRRRSKTETETETEMELRISQKWPVKSSVAVCTTKLINLAQKCFGRDLASKLGCGRVWLVFLSQTVTNQYQTEAETETESVWLVFLCQTITNQ